jgi:hypothetical protein
MTAETQLVDQKRDISQFKKLLENHSGLLGHLLGRGRLEIYNGLSKRSVRFVLVENSKKQNYLTFIQRECFKQNLFYGFNYMVIYEGRTTNQARLATNYTQESAYIALYDYFYIKYKQNTRNKTRFRIQKDILLLPFTEKDLAYWFAEVGDFRNDKKEIVLNLSPCFDEDEGQLLCELINKKLSLTCKLRLFSSSNEIKIRSDQSKKNVFQIVFLTDQLQKFYDLISKYFKNDTLVSNLDKILTLENYALF